MKILSDILKNKGQLHHAYAFAGDKTTLAAELLHFLQKDFGVEIKNNPDFHYQEFETLAIDDGRALQEQHGMRALDGKKVFVIATRFVTTEAQNALLKMFEEPAAGTHFFLIMPNTQVLIPTLRSRLVIVDAGQAEAAGAEVQSLAKKFLASHPAKRIELVKAIVEEKDKGKAIDFVTALEQHLAPQIKKMPTKENAEALAEILVVKKYLHDRAPSVKLLLEHLALFVTIPKL